MPNLLYTALNAFTDDNTVKTLARSRADIEYALWIEYIELEKIKSALEFMHKYPDGNKGRIKACERELKRRGE